MQSRIRLLGLERLGGLRSMFQSCRSQGARGQGGHPPYFGRSVRPGICVKYFLSFPQKKTCHQRKLRQTKCLLYNFWMIKLTKTPILPNFQVPNVTTINFITQKLKSKHLVCFSFLWRQVFWGNERKYFTHIPGQIIF